MYVCVIHIVYGVCVCVCEMNVLVCIQRIHTRCSMYPRGLTNRQEKLIKGKVYSSSKCTYERSKEKGYIENIWSKYAYPVVKTKRQPSTE